VSCLRTRLWLGPGYWPLHEKGGSGFNMLLVPQMWGSFIRPSSRRTLRAVKLADCVCARHAPYLSVQFQLAPSLVNCIRAQGQSSLAVPFKLIRVRMSPEGFVQLPLRWRWRPPRADTVTRTARSGSSCVGRLGRNPEQPCQRPAELEVGPPGSGQGHDPSPQVARDPKSELAGP
jgi:hypothetical protein